MADIGFMLPEGSGMPAMPDPGGFQPGRVPETDRTLRAIAREWPIVLACVAAVMALGVVYLVVAPRYYTSSAVVMAAPRQPDLSRTDSALNGTTTPEPVIVRDPDIEGEIELMSAPSALAHVVRDLKLDDPSNGDISSRPSVYDLLQQLRVVAGLETAAPGPAVTADGLLHQVLGRFGLGGPDATPPPDPNRRTELAVENLARNLKVAPIGRSTMVKIDVTAKDPVMAGRIATAVADHYIQARSQIRAAAAHEASEWLGRHSQELQTELVTAETRLAGFRARAQVDGRDPLQLESDMKVLGDRIVAARAEQAKAVSRLQVAEDRSRREGPIGLLSWEAAPGADEYLAQARAIAELRKEAAKLSAVAGSFNGNVAHIEAEAKTLEAKLNSQAQNRLGNLRMTADAAGKEVASLETSLQAKRAAYDRLQSNGVQLSSLEQAAVAARTVYQGFVARWKTTEQTGFNEAQGWLVSPAGTPVRPSWPSIPLVLLGSAIAGAGLGLSAALRREYRGRRTFRSAEDVERLLPGMRGLGLIPEVASHRGKARDVVAVTGTGSDPEFEESVGNVWTSIADAISPRQPGGRGRVVLITSALPQEGKSAATGIIACAASAAGQRVVVVDCDLRLPAMSTALAVDASPGLADCIEGDVDYHTAIGVNPLKHVSVLPAGRTRLAPQQIFRSPRFGALLANLRTDFDLVLIDSPPVLGLADTRLVAAQADDTILIATWSRTPWRVAALALQTLLRNRVHVAGVVLTRANMNRLAHFSPAEAAPFKNEYRDYYRSYYKQNGAEPIRIKGPVA